MLNYNPIALAYKFFAISLLFTASIASSQAQEASKDSERIGLTLNTEAFKLPARSYQIDCFDRRFELFFDPVTELTNFVVSKDRSKELYSLSDSTISMLGINRKTFVHPSFLCAQRGLSVYLEGYDAQSESSIKQLSVKTFISDLGKISDSVINSEHDDILAVAKRLSSTSILNSLTGDSRNIAKFHGPWLPKETEFILKMSCKDSEYKLSYSPDNKRLFFNTIINKINKQRDLSDSVFLKIMEKRILYLTPTFRCQDNSIEIQYQGIAEMNEEIVEPIAFRIKINRDGQALFFEQTNQLVLDPKSPPIRGSRPIKEKTFKKKLP